MKLVTFRSPAESRSRVGCLVADTSAVIDLSDAFVDMLALIDGGPEALDLVRARLHASTHALPLAEVVLQAPLQPRQMRDAMAFEQHFRQSMDSVARMRVGPFAPLARWLGITRIPEVFYAQPLYYKCNRFSVVGTGHDVRWPAGALQMDYECEIAAVIGKSGTDIEPAQAMDHIFGFTIYNDMTARDLQLAEMAGRLGPAKGKDFDTGNVLGPWLVTRDEVDPYALDMISRVNGKEQGRGRSGDMHHRWDRIVAHVSRNETLHAGEVIGSGTVGNGCGLELGKFLSDGDTVELEVTGLGVLSNRLVKA